MNIAQLIEELCISNIKLFDVCNKKAAIASNPAGFSKEEAVETIGRDIELCKQRARIKTEINRVLNEAVVLGKLDIVDEVKQYGN